MRSHWAAESLVAIASLIASTAAGQHRLQNQLESLDPGQARGYLRLAEQLADEAATPEDVRLARRLFVYALQVGRESDDPAQRTLGASAALALASDAASETERRWLLSMAGELDDRLVSASLDPDAPPKWDWSVGLMAAEALGLARSGEGREAAERLEEPSVREVLNEISPLLGIRGAGGAAGWVERTAVGWPCPQCGNQRVTHRRRDGQVAIERCPTCLANPGLRSMRVEELTRQLRAELRLLDGSVRSWSAQIEMDHGAPLREPSASGLQRFYGVDPLARVWVEGEWVRPSPSEPEPESETESALDSSSGSDGPPEEPQQEPNPDD